MSNLLVDLFAALVRKPDYSAPISIGTPAPRASDAASIDPDCADPDCGCVTRPRMTYRRRRT